MAPHPALRRQDSTAQPSIATPTATEHVSHEPKIGGSEAAFVAVVILLAIIAIAASAGIYFLLRNSEPSPADRAARRKYSIRRRGAGSHPLPIGLPGSFSEKIGSVFKGRRAGTGGGWMPARDYDDDDDTYAGGEWDSTDEPLRVRELELDRHGDVSSSHQHDGDEYPRVGVTPASRHTTLTEASTDSGAHKSRSASHVNTGDDESSSPDGLGRDDPLVPTLTRKQHEDWLSARDPRSGVDNGGGTTNPLRYLTPEPRRADSGHEIPLFAGSTPFQD